MPIVSLFPTGSGSSSGGGIPLAPVTNITTLSCSGKVYFKWTDSVDTVVGDATLASWAGTLLVRKAGSMPTNRRDGTVVLDNKTRDAYADQYFCDSGLADGVTYYYKFFPYSTTNTYTDDAANEVTITPNPVPTGDVTGIAVVATLNGRVQINWTDPAATKVTDGVTLSTWASTQVIYKTDGYPTSPEDGTLVINSTTRNAYSSSPLEVAGLTNGTTYYFAFFPISTEGAVNTNTANGITAIPNRIKITTVPSQNNTLTYTGKELSPTWSNYNSAQLTIGGVVKGTNAGTYSATFTPTDDYCWSDGTIGAKTVTWTIGKATGSISISPTSTTFNMSNKSRTLTVNLVGDGTWSAKSNNTGVATIGTISGNSIPINSVNNTNGEATITVTVVDGTNYTYSKKTATCSVAASFVSSVLNENSWDVIGQVSDEGTGSSYWAVGDAKQITVNGTVGLTSISNFAVWAFILGFNHNSAKEGTNRIHFQIGRTAQTYSASNGICFVDSTYGSYNSNNGSFTMNPASSSSSSTNSGGWNNSHMRKTLLGSAGSPTSPTSGTFLAALPSDLRAVMKSCTKYSDNTGGGSNTASYVTATTDYLWLLAEFEVQGARSYANSAEQNYQLQYDYYKNGNSKIRYKHNATTTTAYWWLRSVLATTTTSFCIVYTGGSANYNFSGFCYGVAPAFCV